MENLVQLNRNFFCGFIENPNNIAFLLSDIILLLIASAFLGFFAIVLDHSSYVQSLSSLRQVPNQPTTNGISISFVFTVLVGFIAFIYSFLNLSPFESTCFQVVVFVWCFGFVINKISKYKKPQFNWPMRKVLLFCLKNKHQFSWDFIALAFMASFTVILRGFPLVYKIFVFVLLVLGRLDVVLWYDFILVVLTILIILPPVQFYFRTKYGKDVFRLLGYNTGAGKAALAASGFLVLD